VAQEACTTSVTSITWWDDRFLHRQPLTLSVATQVNYTRGITQVVAVWSAERNPYGYGTEFDTRKLFVSYRVPMV
jgi:hypothetical protein